MPHPPVVVPEVGRGREREIGKTLEAMRQASECIVANRPDTIIIISPHAPVLRDQVLIQGAGLLKGDLGRFGARGASVGFDGDVGMARLICEEARAAGIDAVAGDASGSRGGGLFSGGGLDHGTVVPLYFINEALTKSGAAAPKLVVISIAYFDNERLFRFGGCIARAAEKSGSAAALITSGDLSHKLTDDGPYGYDPYGPEFDRHIVRCIATRDVRRLLETDETLLERAAQCGFYGLVMLYGALEADRTCVKTPDSTERADGVTPDDAGRAVPGRVLSYEGIFGVGYAIAQIL